VAFTGRRTIAIGAATAVACTLSYLGTSPAESRAHTTTVADDCTYQLQVLPVPPPRHQVGVRDYSTGAVHGSDGVDRFAGIRRWRVPAPPIGGVGQPGESGSSGFIFHNNVETYLEGGPGFKSAQASDVNRSGIAVGTKMSATSLKPVFWPADSPGNPTALATPAGATTVRPTAINDAGLIVGYAEFGTGDGAVVRGVSWTVDAPNTVTDLGVRARIFDVSEAGRAVGYTGTVENPATAVAGTVAGVSPIPGQTGTTGGYAFATAGRFTVGRAGVNGAAVGPVLWDNGTPHSLPAQAPGWPDDPADLTVRVPAPAYPIAVNTAGLVVANAFTVPRVEKFVGYPNIASYLKDGRWVDLPTQQPDTEYGGTTAFTVTEDGTIGGAVGSIATDRPALWHCR
jgi:hypothetical protein